jgi:tRNA(adenine34) deaminase
MTDEEAMDLALAQAEAALAAGEVPVGAVLLRDGQVICAARNRREELRDPTAHAEILCLREGARLLGDWRLRGCTLAVTLEPCPMCAGALVMSQLDRCVFGAADPDRGCCGSVYDLPADPALQGRARWRAGVREAECRALLDRFFSGLRRR